MLLNFAPVIAQDLMTSARRSRHTTIRVLYGLVVLILIFSAWVSAQHLFWRTGTVRFDVLSYLGRELVRRILIGQVVTIVLLTPAMVAGAIAEERQRRTLHYLMTSDLNSLEIVLGKLLARVWSIGLFVMMTLPVLSTMLLYGGVGLNEILVGEALSIALLLFLASFSMLISVWSRRSRDAVLGTYLLMAFWFLIAGVVQQLVMMGVSGSSPVVSILFTIFDTLYLVSPWRIYNLIDTGIGPRMGLLFDREVMLTLGALLGFTALFVGLATWRLRPSFRKIQDETRRRFLFFIPIPKRFNRPLKSQGLIGRQVFPAPPCGNRPLIWKEMWHQQRGLFVRAVILLMVVLVLPFVLVITGLNIWDTIVEVWEYGYGTTDTEQSYRDRLDFQKSVAVMTLVLFVIGMFGLVQAAAGSITTEREKDTWLSLLGVPASASEFVRAKMLGALWSQRYCWYGIAILWTLALLCGSLRPWSLVVSLLGFAIMTGFAASLGVRISMAVRSSLRAQATAQFLVVGINCLWLLGGIDYDRWKILDWTCVGHLIYNGQFHYQSEPSPVGMVNQCLGLLAYGIATLILTASSINQFDWLNERIPSPVDIPSDPFPQRSGG